ncbi:hypothetical protein BC939DRAFT_291864 [Gamsiella multidivaricata]|uniref:uncharacterized protein n=1 Tax=Gamsiella multidivaricata TaxID=101098 RepID=UPI00221E6D3B|nr:uncharacterized protein BC939DRAFT_291864 [Gamsiella multidivaricata]KAI7818548.1 hypothetical protein BC939DRAFT_291864 [Gamsiella multidivaricata]
MLPFCFFATFLLLARSRMLHKLHLVSKDAPSCGVPLKALDHDHTSYRSLCLTLASKEPPEIDSTIRMYRHLPADYCDLQTARCRVSPRKFKESGLIVGHWVLLQSTDSNHGDQIYCRVWPARYDCQDDILVDRYITKTAQATQDRDEDVRIRTDTSYSMKVLESPIRKALRLQVVVSQIRKDGVLSSEGAAYEEATDLMKQHIVHNALQDLVLEEGFSVANEHAGLLIMVCHLGGMRALQR